MSNLYKKGVIFALLTALISGFSIFYNKLVITKGIDPVIFNILKNGGVAFMISLLIISSHKLTAIKKLTVSDWQKLLVIGIIGGSIPFILYFEGLKTVTAVSANLIHKSLFLWVATLAIPFLGERINFWQAAGYLLVVWSNLFIGGFSGFTGSQGELMIFAATILWSAELIIAKIALKDIESNIVAWGRMAIGSLILIIIALFQGKFWLMAKIPADYLLPVIGSIILLCGYITSLYKALKFAPTTVVTSILILSTPITNFLSAIFITHEFPQPQIQNLVLVLIGVVFISLFSANLEKRKALKTSI